MIIIQNLDYLIHKPKIEYCWSSGIFWGTPGISKVMSHNQFRLILCNLAFAMGRIKKDRLHKIRPLIEKIINTSRNLYAPKEFLSIDESIVKFNRRNVMKVLIFSNLSNMDLKSTFLQELIQVLY